MTVTKIYKGTEVIELPAGSTSAPSTGAQSIFTGATIPLTYLNNTHDYENNYEYKSGTHNITITGLEGRATITGNGTKDVIVAFDVTSETSSLKNFTITCVKDTETLTYKGLYAYYGTNVTGILTFAYNNITIDGSEGVIGTNYKFIVTASTDAPVFSAAANIWNTIYSHQVLNVLMGNYSSATLSSYFLFHCYSFNQPLIIPTVVTNIGLCFLAYCHQFNQPLTIPDSVTTIQMNFMEYCYLFDQPLTIPSGVTTIGTYFLAYCYSFNQPLTIPAVSVISDYFMEYCYSFNQPVVIPNAVTSIGVAFLNYCCAFNETITISNSVTSIGASFLNYCYLFNHDLVIPNSVKSIGDNFLTACASFNKIVTLSNTLTTIGTYFLNACVTFNKPLILPNSLASIGAFFMRNCFVFNQQFTIPSGLTSISTYFMNCCYSLSILTYEASVYPTDAYSLSQDKNTKTSASGAGIIIYGSKRAELMTALPNYASSPFRKLIDGGM